MRTCCDFGGKPWLSGLSRCSEPHPRSRPYHLFMAPSPDSAEPDRPRLPQRAGGEPPCPWPLSHEPTSPPSSRWAPGIPCGLSIPPHPKDCVNGCGHPMEAGIAQRACGCGPALMAVRLFSDNSSGGGGAVRCPAGLCCVRGWALWVWGSWADFLGSPSWLSPLIPFL